MKLFSRTLKTLVLASLCLSPTTAMSDIFILNDGKKLKGKIIDQTYEYYVLKVEIAENVLGEKKVLIKDVKEIIRDDESKHDYTKIKALFPTSDFLTLADYEKIKKDYFTAFYKSHPNSKHTDTIKALELKLDKEYQTLKSGGLKINGKLISKEQIELNRYEVMAHLEYQKIRHFAKSKKYISALRSYEKMKRDYKHTSPFPLAAKTIHGILPKFVELANDLKSSVTSAQEKRKRYIETLADVDKARTKRLLEKEDANYAQSLLRATEELKTKWLPLYKYDEEPIKQVLDHAKKEAEWLEAASKNNYLDQSRGKNVDGGKLYRDILSAIENNDIELSNELLNDFQRLNPPASYSKDLKLKIITAKNRKEMQLAKEKQAALEKKKQQEAKEKEEREAQETKEKTPKKKSSSTEEKIKDKLNINKKEKFRKELEKELNR